MLCRRARSHTRYVVHDNVLIFGSPLCIPIGGKMTHSPAFGYGIASCGNFGLNRSWAAVSSHLNTRMSVWLYSDHGSQFPNLMEKKVLLGLARDPNCICMAPSWLESLCVKVKICTFFERFLTSLMLHCVVDVRSLPVLPHDFKFFLWFLLFLFRNKIF